MNRSYCSAFHQTSTLFLVLFIVASVPFAASSSTPKNGFSFQINGQTGATLYESACFRRIKIPHFRVKDYSVPGSTFIDPDECPQIQTQNQFRGSLVADDYRLSKTVLPIHYLIKICPRVHYPFNFTGSVEIDLKVNETTNEITLNALHLTILDIFIWPHRVKLPEDIEPLRRFNPSTKYGLYRRTNSKFKNFRKHIKAKNNNTLNIKDPHLPLARKKKFVLPFYKENGRKSKLLTITSIKMDSQLQKIIIRTKEDLYAKNIYKMKIQYTGSANRGYLKGLYETSHLDNKNKTRYSLVTQFQVSDARRAFPCFDEPGFKASFTISLCRHYRLQTLSNMPKIATFPKKDEPGVVWDTFKTTVPMSTYLVAFAILDDYDYMDCNHSSIPFRVWVPSNRIHQAEFSCNVSPLQLDFFEDYFQIPYPLPKMDLLAVEEFFALGMENWGLVTFLDKRLLIDNDSPFRLESEGDALETISHEMAHQWFGNLVTPSWWSDIWLNEGFATFLSLLGIDYIHPSRKVLEESIVTALHPVLASDSMESSHPVVYNVSDPIDFFSIFDEISYVKGCFMVRMMMHILTEKAFQNGLQTFLKEKAYKSASQHDLWYFLTRAGHQAGTLLKNLSIAEIMDTWIFQEGYPLVTVTRLPSGDLAVTQKRYYQEPDEELASKAKNILTETSDPKWWIPVSVITQQNPNMSDTIPKFWMNSESHVYNFDPPPSPEDWFLLNVRRTGFFRVNYDKQNWELLIRQLRDNHLVFDEITRLQLIDDSFVLAFSNRVGFDTPLELVLYLTKEESPFVISAAIDNLSALLRLYRMDAMYGSLKDLLVTLFSAHYPRNGLRNRFSNTPFVRQCQNSLIKTICQVYEPCIEESKLIFEEWAKNPQNDKIVDEDIFEAVLCTAVAEGGQREWETAFNIILHHTAFSDMVPILSCTRHLWLFSRVLALLSRENSSVYRQIHLPLFLREIAKNPFSFPIAWEYFRTTWPSMFSTIYEGVYFEAVIPYITSRFQFEDAVNFVNSHVLVNGSAISPHYVKELLFNVKRKMNFYQHSYETIFNWFYERQTINIQPLQSDLPSESKQLHEAPRFNNFL